MGSRRVGDRAREQCGEVVMVLVCGREKRGAWFKDCVGVRSELKADSAVSSIDWRALCSDYY